MRKLVYAFLVMSLVLVGDQVIAAQHKSATVALQSNDGRVIRCEISKSDYERLKHFRQGQQVRMYTVAGDQYGPISGALWQLLAP